MYHNCKNCIHQSACKHSRIGAANPLYQRPSDPATGDCADWHSAYITPCENAVSNRQELKHGVWHYISHHEMVGHVWRCSVCERLLFTRSLTYVIDDYPYCHCGAKMYKVKFSEKLNSEEDSTNE